MVKIRLARLGTKHKPFFRIVVADERQKRNGKVIQVIGFYDPKTKPPTLKIDRPKLKAWLAKGAQPTTALRKLLNEKTASVLN